MFGIALDFRRLVMSLGKKPVTDTLKESRDLALAMLKKHGGNPNCSDPTCLCRQGEKAEAEIVQTFENMMGHLGALQGRQPVEANMLVAGFLITIDMIWKREADRQGVAYDQMDPYKIPSEFIKHLLHILGDAVATVSSFCPAEGPEARLVETLGQGAAPNKDGAKVIDMTDHVLRSGKVPTSH